MKPKEKANTQNRWMIVLKVIIGLFIVSIISSFLLTLMIGESQYGNVARISISGTITSDRLGDTSSKDIVELIKEAESDPQIKAIIFEINSPGGSPVGSYEIADAIKKTNLTTVALIREVGASGAYWAATSTDHIIANPLSITGSIGVIGSYLEFSGFLNRYNVTYERLVAGKYKDYGSPFRKLTSDERKKIQGEIDDIYDYFVMEVATNRNLSYEYVESLATGEVFIGSEAKRLGLVDELGSFDEAEEYLKSALNTTEIVYVDYAIERGFFDVFSQISSDFAFDVGTGIGSAIGKENMVIRT